MALRTLRCTAVATAASRQPVTSTLSVVTRVAQRFATSTNILPICAARLYARRPLCRYGTQCHHCHALALRFARHQTSKRSERSDVGRAEHRDDQRARTSHSPHSAVWIDPKARFLVGWTPCPAQP